MITITESKTGITVDGHARYAETGKDIVCAGVCTLIHTLCGAVSKLTVDQILYNAKPGHTEIEIPNPSEQSKLLRHSFLVGVRMLEKKYPDHVKVILRGADGRKTEGEENENQKCNEEV